MALKAFIKKHILSESQIDKLKKKRDKKILSSRIKCQYKFKDRRKKSNKVCIVLAGYKPFLYDITFKRIKKFIPDDIDVCVVTSGMYSEDIYNRCKKNHWSYLSTKENNVALVQNLAIHLHPEAQYIYKLDEDIFVTKNYFEILYKTLLKVEQEEPYNPLFVAPIIPINGYAHLRLLDKLNLIEEYEKRFEKTKYAAGIDRMIENNPDVAKFFWGEGNIVPGIDTINARLNSAKFEYSVCPIRFSIGAILFTRKVWSDMKGFSVNRRTTSMGDDEVELCSIAMKESKAIIVSENTIAGHLSFGPQNKEMEVFYNNNKDKFDIIEVESF